MGKRYVATFTAYIYAENDLEAISNAKEVERSILDVGDNKGKLERLSEQPFGTFSSRKVDIIDSIHMNGVTYKSK